MVTGSLYDFVMDQNCHMRFIIISICHYIIMVLYKYTVPTLQKGKNNKAIIATHFL